MYDLGTIGAAVTLDTADYYKNLAGLGDESENTFKKVATTAATYLSGSEIGSFADKAIASFSNIQETVDKFSGVFSLIPTATDKASGELSTQFAKLGINLASFRNEAGGAERNTGSKEHGVKRNTGSKEHGVKEHGVKPTLLRNTGSNLHY